VVQVILRFGKAYRIGQADGEKGSQTRAKDQNKLAVVLYPFTAAAVAINLFMIGLMWQALGLSAISPVNALILAIPLGIPATILVARWVRRLMDEADT
jgi:hypothetical protein